MFGFIGTAFCNRLASDKAIEYRALTRAFKACKRGNITMMFALGLPGLLGAVGVASDFAVLEMKRTSLQAAADTSALAAAKELSIASSTDSSIVAAARNYVATELTANDANAVTTVTVDHKKGSVTVALSEVWTPFFAHFINSGVTPVSVQATGILAGSTNICVLALHPTSNQALVMTKTAKLTANGCAVYSNSNHSTGLFVDSGASLTATLTCSVGGAVATGIISPSALTDCSPVNDPLAGRAAPTFSGCDFNAYQISGGTAVLTPGVYCGGLSVTGKAQVTLTSGTYVIQGGALTVAGQSSFTGDHVAFYLSGDSAVINFNGLSTVALSGAKDGDMAGLLFFEDRAAIPDRMHRINSDKAQNLTGTIYLSRGYLKIDPNTPVANNSAYTAIIVSRLELTQSPTLVLNSNYGSTDVPVPAGIQSSASVFLSN